MLKGKTCFYMVGGVKKRGWEGEGVVGDGNSSLVGKK